ncbi:hypothetical protein [Saccharomonospora saliphila]|uniref:hypothetical protein n=1 Tax=Saccharomonospora saliphila TaxID=369829 RepID=UPI000374C1BF|nr:hypothetical protein [Saccharomonospora saliphila]
MADGFFDESKTLDEGAARSEPDPLDTATSLFGSGFNTESVARMNAQGEAMLESAKNGGFRISERGAEGLLNTVRGMKDDIDGLRYTFDRLAQNPKLGCSPYARQVAAHDRKSADGGTGVVDVMQAFRHTLDLLEEALLRASSQYRESEEDARAVWKGE